MRVIHGRVRVRKAKGVDQVRRLGGNIPQALSHESEGGEVMGEEEKGGFRKKFKRSTAGKNRLRLYQSLKY